MRRGGPLPRYTRLRTRTRIRQVNPERARRRRAEAFGAQAELARSLPCCVPGCWEGPPSDPAHVRSRGAGGRDRGNVAPLCRAHHIQQHAWGVETFGARLGLDLHAEARRLERLAYREEGE